MPAHMTDAELDLMEKKMKNGAAVDEILKIMQRKRREKGLLGPSRATVYRFKKGDTYERDAEENRGRPATLPTQVLKVADAECKKLIKKASMEHRVVWEDVREATERTLKERKVLKRGRRMWSADWLARKMRESLNVRCRQAKGRIARTKKDEERRLGQGKEWQKYPPAWWKNSIHAYIDSKKWVLARTAKEKKLMRQARVRQHLRTPSEGRQPGFVATKKGRMLTGIRSVEVCAAVAKNRIIMWHVVPSCGGWGPKRFPEQQGEGSQGRRADTVLEAPTANTRVDAA